MPPAPTLEEKVDFLSRRDAYPGRPAQVDAVETYMSWVFLTPGDVYKLKKPLSREHLDFSTAEARLRNCRAEVELNRRLARGVYRGVEALSVDAGNRLQLGKSADTRPVDWLVHMRRLPADCMLDALLKEKRASRDELEHVARFLADFYRWAAKADFRPEQYLQRQYARIEANANAMLEPRYRLPAAQIERIGAAQRRFLTDHSEFLARRVEQRLIVEAHGDLRPQHICIGEPPLVIDCLEFNRELRLLDPVDELAYLGVECEKLDAGFAGEAFFDIYRRRIDDPVPDALIAFYKSCRAVLRAGLCARHLDDEHQRARGDWHAEARRYLDVAEHYSRSLMH